MALDTLRPLSSTDDEGTKHAITPEVQMRALKDWLRTSRNQLNHNHLGYCLDRALGDVWKGHWPFARAADSLIRRMKKDEWLVKSEKNRGWRLTPKGEKALGV